ncbi:hypothetical protein D1O30_11170 [Methylocystis hirsuta]|uniref:Uncharacterized protein n=1 Tax=Methylocystis hirsuta TaxID=369798 RepID=A0A3M9XP29_9HYPH|nr:hypothetical protein D1O30_11170 [Methylocystis hirsuta]
MGPAPMIMIVEMSVLFGMPPQLSSARQRSFALMPRSAVRRVSKQEGEICPAVSSSLEMATAPPPQDEETFRLLPGARRAGGERA